MAIHLQSSIHPSIYPTIEANVQSLLLWQAPKLPVPWTVAPSTFPQFPLPTCPLCIHTVCLWCWPKLNAFVRSLFSLTLIEFCEFYRTLSHFPLSTAVFLQYSSFFYLSALWPLVRLAAGATFIWLNLLWTITKTVENCCPRGRLLQFQLARLSSNPTGIALTFTIWSMGTSLARKKAYISPYTADGT